MLPEKVRLDPYRESHIPSVLPVRLQSVFVLHHVHLRRLVLLDHVRKDIFDYIVSELGSLERMDEQIRSLIGKMLKKNLSNVGHATDSLLHELGQI